MADVFIFVGIILLIIAIYNLYKVSQEIRKSTKPWVVVSPSGEYHRFEDKDAASIFFAICTAAEDPEKHKFGNIYYHNKGPLTYYMFKL